MRLDIQVNTVKNSEHKYAIKTFFGNFLAFDSVDKSIVQKKFNELNDRYFLVWIFLSDMPIIIYYDRLNLPHLLSLFNLTIDNDLELLSRQFSVIPLGWPDCYAFRCGDGAHLCSFPTGELVLHQAPIREWETFQLLSESEIEPEKCVDEVTVVVTSCGRHDLLGMTLKSFVENNTYDKIKKIIVVEDGDADPSSICDKFGAILIKAGGRFGQPYAIDLAYSFVRTPYIFHCEDDWEFYRGGFIEKSLNLLKYDPSCVCVWLRAWNDTNGHPLQFRSDDKTFGVLSIGYGDLWGGFTWNPSLRRITDYQKIGPFSQKMGGQSDMGESDASIKYMELGYRGVILDEAGYVRHIGWDRHVY